MPRVSQKKAAQTRARILEGACQIIIEQGGEALTFTNLAQQVGISRSGINCHFKKKAELLAEIRPCFKALILQPLSFTSGERFYLSWVKAVKADKQYQNMIKYAGTLSSPAEGLLGFKKLISGNADDVERYVYMAIGFAAVYLSEEQSCCGCS
ncbi:MAG: hypothetical protein ACI9T7_003893 [Oleiphilaceae bacterium]|jgi:hypothetical protein